MLQMTIESHKLHIEKQEEAIQKLNEELEAIKAGATAKRVKALESEKQALTQRVTMLVFEVSLSRGPWLRPTWSA